MKYTQLTEHMHKYISGKISKAEIGCAIHMWQRSNYPVEEDGNVKGK